jgi:EpsI family protein
MMPKQWLVMASLYSALGVFGVVLPVGIAVSDHANQPSELIPLHFTVSPLWKSYGTDAGITEGELPSVRTYVSGIDSVQVAIEYYGIEHDASEMMNAANKQRYRGDGIVLSEGKDTVRVNAKPFVVDAANIRLFSHSRLLWRWYSIDGTFTANPYLATLLQIKSVLVKGPYPEASITVWIDYTDKQEVAAATLQDFLTNTIVQ